MRSTPKKRRRSGRHWIESVQRQTLTALQHDRASIYYIHGSLGDAILIGVSRIEQLEPSMRAAKNGPLPEAVVAACVIANHHVAMKSEYYLQYPYPKEGSPWRDRLS